MVGGRQQHPSTCRRVIYGRVNPGSMSIEGSGAILWYDCDDIGEEVNIYMDLQYLINSISRKNVLRSSRVNNLVWKFAKRDVFPRSCDHFSELLEQRVIVDIVGGFYGVTSLCLLDLFPWLVA